MVAMEVIPNYEVGHTKREAFLKARNADSDKLEEGESAESGQDHAAELTQSEYDEMLNAECLLLTISHNGKGKLISSFDFATKGRGGLGVKAMRVGGIVSLLKVNIEDQIMLTTDSGQSIRCQVSDISFQSRFARGVRIIDLTDGEEVVSVARINEPEEESEAHGAESQEQSQRT